MVNAPPHPSPTEALVALAQLVVAGAGYDRLLNETARATARTLDADRCEILCLSPEGETLLRVATTDEDAAGEERETVPGGVSSAAGYALLCGAPVVSGDLQSDRRFGKADAPRGAVSVVAAPVTGKEEPFGVLIAYTARERAFKDYHALAVSRTGSLLGGALRRLEELEGLRRRAGEVEHHLSAPFLKGGTQKCASGASAVWEDDPKPMLWLSGLVAGWQPSLPDRSRSCRQSPVRPKPAAGKAATRPR